MCISSESKKNCWIGNANTRTCAQQFACIAKQKEATTSAAMSMAVFAQNEKLHVISFRCVLFVWHRPRRTMANSSNFFVLIYSEYDWFCALIIHITQRKKETNETFARLLCKWKCKCKRGQTWHVCEFEPNALPKKIFFDTFRCVWRGAVCNFSWKIFSYKQCTQHSTYHDRIWISMLRRNCKYFRGKILWKMLFLSPFFATALPFAHFNFLCTLQELETFFRLFVRLAHIVVWFIVLEWAFYWRWTAIEKRWTMAWIVAKAEEAKKKPRAHAHT